jgi:hypothetical protein
MADRAGQLRGPMLEEELEFVFLAVKDGRRPIDARRELSLRDSNTVNRAYKIVADFERLGLKSLDGNLAEEIAERARYSSTPSLVQGLFLRWRAWRNALDGRKNSSQPMSPPARSALREVSESLAYVHPHQCIAFNLDLQSPARQALKKLSPDDDVSRLYREALTKHRLVSGSIGAKQSDDFTHRDMSLREAGVWENHIEWEKISQQYRDLLVDWCRTISFLVEKGLEYSIEGSRRKRLEISATQLERQPFSLNDPFAGIPWERRDGKLVGLMTVIPNSISVVLMCDLLTMAASAQESHSGWFKELLELEKLRESALAAQLVGDQAFANIKEWRKVAQQIWEEPDEEPDDWSLRRKTEELAASFQAIVVATDELRQQLNALISD